MHIVTLMNCVHDYGRRSLEGIARFGQTRGGWTLELHHIEHVHQRLPRLDAKSRGIIAHAHSPKLLDALSRCGLPVVNTSSVAPDLSNIAVLPDNREIGRMAAEEMIGLGHRRMLTIAVKPWGYSHERAETFKQTAEAAGASVRVLTSPSWRQAEARITKALSEAATPLGVFAGSDGLAVLVVRQALALGLTIPEQVAVLGVDNDTLTTRMVSPTISSIELPWEKLGFTAATLLDRMIQGEPVEPEPIMIRPSRVITRQTTDGVAIEDPDVATAIQAIREHASEPAAIQRVLERVPLSRRALEQRFKRAVGRTIQTHVTHVRLEQAKQMLTTTDYPMPEIAKRCGFADPGYFATVFKKHTDRSPSAYRAAYRLS